MWTRKNLGIYAYDTCSIVESLSPHQPGQSTCEKSRCYDTVVYGFHRLITAQKPSLPVPTEIPIVSQTANSHSVHVFEFDQAKYDLRSIA
jgi:hypothetical protein